MPLFNRNTLFKNLSQKGGAVAFDVTFDAMEIASAIVEPEKVFIAPLELIETETELRLAEPNGTTFPLRFLSWFRWIWLGGTGCIAYGLHDAAPVGWLFAIFLVGMGLLGAFLIIPLLLGIFSRIKRLQTKRSANLPALNLQRRLLILPAGRGTVPWAELRGFDLGPVAPDSWFPLQAHTTDGRILFLANYPQSGRRQAEKHAQIFQHQMFG